MATKTDTIEVDAATADLLKARAAQRGVTVSELLAELVDLESTVLAVGSDELTEPERRWSAVGAGEATVDHEEVVRWLNSWGTPQFKPWNER